ncbi:hypothetical protein L211DRAFT_848721 [Terfezia boudieri ATCC MYA-4762]|uniref:Uncharacterized protein n=1 Tax=Terfezia boudieri ATCC MYA-4762 TaxID=1051890 RepID=A0A3N4LND5_9PEZI|nr:hypothetical protein L211DRAFT_848721 [Terfezia boudieri ATCC MYA-4762]
MPAFPLTIGIPESPNQLDSADDRFDPSIQTTVLVQQSQDSEEASERGETDAEGSVLKIHSSDARPGFPGRFFHGLLPTATPSVAISSIPSEGVLSGALTETALAEDSEVASKETAANVLIPVLRKNSPRKYRDRFQSRMQLQYQHSGRIQSPVNHITQQETSSNLNPTPANVLNHKLVQLYDRLVNSYGSCPPPPHSGKGWLYHCRAKEYIEASTTFDLLPVKGLGTGIGLREYSFLLFGVFICLAGIILWFYGLIHSIRYIRRNYVSAQHSRQYQGRPLLPQIYGRKFSKSRSRKGISEGWRNEGQKNGEVIWPEEEQEKVSPIINNYPYDMDDEESTIYEKSLSDTEKTYESRYGKSIGRVLLDGLVGSMKGGTWLRRVFGSRNSGERSWREAITTRHSTSGNPSTDGNAPDLIGGYSDTLGQVGLSDSVRSASGVDMNWERGEVTLSFRRDALLRRAIRADRSRMDGGGLSAHARSATSSIRGAETNHNPTGRQCGG